MPSRVLTMTLGVFLGLGLLAAGATSASAKHFRACSKDHIDTGVSQYSNFLVDGDTYDGSTVFLTNTNHVDQTAAIFVYEREGNGFVVTPGTFRGCLVRSLIPHQSDPIDADDFRIAIGAPLDQSADVSVVVDVLWAPNTPVKVGTSRKRKADGLGGRAGEDDSFEHNLANPGLFSLPDDSIVLGQNQAAKDCVCTELNLLGRSRNTLKPFGISYP